MSVTPPENNQGTHYYDGDPKTAEEPKSVSPEIKMDAHRHLAGLRTLIADMEDAIARAELTSKLRDLVEAFQVHSRLARRRQVAQGIDPDKLFQGTGVTPEVQKSVDEQDAKADDSSVSEPVNTQPPASSVFVNEQPQVTTPEQPVSTPGVEGTPVTRP